MRVRAIVCTIGIPLLSCLSLGISRISLDIDAVVRTLML